jgi:N-acetylmuramoyl-L-alanine amidase
VQAGGIIVELFFISNADDLRRYEEKKWILGRKVAETLVAHATI